MAVRSTSPWPAGRWRPPTENSATGDRPDHQSVATSRSISVMSMVRVDARGPRDAAHGGPGRDALTEERPRPGTTDARRHVAVLASRQSG